MCQAPLKVGLRSFSPAAGLLHPSQRGLVETLLSPSSSLESLSPATFLCAVN
jgi:hypothetical protein